MLGRVLLGDLPRLKRLLLDQPSTGGSTLLIKAVVARGSTLLIEAVFGDHDQTAEVDCVFGLVLVGPLTIG